jgi:phosphate transport system substrate-binding protein
VNKAFYFFGKRIAAAASVAAICAIVLAAKGDLQGNISIDGSSTVYPVTEAVSEEFGQVNPNVKVTVGISGTGGGFKRFCVGETDISNASRPIKSSEIEAATQNNVQFVEIPICFDGLAVVVNKNNTWVDKLTVEELKKIWAPGSKINNWSQVRSGFPNKALKLYGPGTDSGTFDYFTEAINGKSGESRSDYTASEDDNVLVQGVGGDAGGLGYFGVAYYEENKDQLRVVPIDGGKGAFEPTTENVKTGKYSPLSRPLFIYVSTASLKRDEVSAYVDFYIKNAAQLSKEVGYIPFPSTSYAKIAEHYSARKTGSAFSGKDTVGLTIEEVLATQK